MVLDNNLEKIADKLFNKLSKEILECIYEGELKYSKELINTYKGQIKRYSQNVTKDFISSYEQQLEDIKHLYISKVIKTYLI